MARGFRFGGAGSAGSEPTSVALIPTMTSNTTPSGTASSSSNYNSSYPAYLAFNNTASSGWNSSGSGTAEWVQYSFVSPVVVKSILGVEIGNTTTTLVTTKFKFQASNDGSTWIDLSEELESTSSARWTGTVNIPNNKTAYISYRIYQTYGSKGLSCAELQLYGFVVS